MKANCSIRAGTYVGAALAFLLWSTPALSAQEKPTLFVAPLEGDVSQIMAWQPALGEGLAEMLITEINKIGKFDVLESTALENLKDEIRLGEEGFVAADDKVAKGGWAGADFMFRGKVSRFGSKQQGVGLGGFGGGGLGNLGLKTQTSDVRIDWRLVDVYTRKVIHTGSAEGTHKGTGFDIGVAVRGAGGNIGFGNQEFMNSALGKATVKAVTNITAALAGMPVPESGRRKAKAGGEAKVQAEAKAVAEAAKSVPGKVLAVVNEQTVIVSLGSKQGFKAGDKLSVFETVDTKDEQGNVVFTEEKLAGEATLESVQEERSKAAYSGAAKVKAGWVVRHP